MPPMQPQSPNQDFDFMLKNQPQAKRTLGLPSLSKPVKIILGAVVAVILLIILASVFSGGSGVSTNVAGAMARGAEIQRVTAEVQQLNLQQSSTQVLAATVAATLASDQAQLQQYLANNHTKVSTAQLAVDTDKSTDTQMQSAVQNNNLDQTYIAYLQQSLTKYSSDMQKAYTAAGPNGKAILSSSLYSINTLLSNPPLKA